MSFKNNSQNTGDFQDETMSMSFGDGTQIGEAQCAAFGIDDDDIMEPVESFTVNAAGGIFVNQRFSTQVIISDNDSEQKQSSEQRCCDTADSLINADTLRPVISVLISEVSGF